MRMLWLAHIYTNTGNSIAPRINWRARGVWPSRSATRRRSPKWRCAPRISRTGEAIAWPSGAPASRRSSTPSAADSSKWLARAYLNLGDSYLKTRDFAESLKYSKQALPLVSQMRGSGDETIVLFNEGLAYIGLGNIKPGEKLAEVVITDAIQGDNLLDAKEYLREYAERARACRDI